MSAPFTLPYCESCGCPADHGAGDLICTRNQRDAAESQSAALRAQLAAISSEAIKVIRIFHGPAGWEEYQQSPEMKRFRAALSGAGGGPTPEQLADCEQRLARIGQEFLDGMEAAPRDAGGGP